MISILNEKFKKKFGEKILTKIYWYFSNYSIRNVTRKFFLSVESLKGKFMSSILLVLVHLLPVIYDLSYIYSPVWFRIRIWNTDPDPQSNSEYGSNFDPDPQHCTQPWLLI